jgi:hypothetical protein
MLETPSETAGHEHGVRPVLKRIKRAFQNLDRARPVEVKRGTGANTGCVVFELHVLKNDVCI